MDERSRQIYERAFAILDKPFVPTHQDVEDDPLPVRRSRPRERSERRLRVQPRGSTNVDAWDAWLDRRVDEKLRVFCDGIADGAGELHRQLEQRIADLRIEVEALRTELNLAKAENFTRLRREDAA